MYDILTCAMAYRLTGDERFLNRAKNDLLTVAAFPDWDPAHNLAVGETSFAVAIGYDWLFPKLKPEQRAIIQQALVDKSLAYADNFYRRGGGWTTNTGNHNQVCNAGLVSAALALADEEPALARRVIDGRLRFDAPCAIRLRARWRVSRRSWLLDVWHNVLGHHIRRTQKCARHRFGLRGDAGF